MLGARLTLALEEGLVTAPLAVIGAPGDLDTAALPAPLTAVTDRQPDSERLARRGIATSREIPQGLATAIVALPRERAAARDRIARAMAAAQRVLVDGQKTDGVDAILKAARARGEVSSVISKAHGKLFAFTAADLADWTRSPQQIGSGHWTAPGSFSADGIDPASRLLAAHLPPLKGRVADLGAGWGYLSGEILRSDAVERLDLVEADAAALDCARRNVTDPRAAFHWADATAWRADAPLDHVVTNPPFHVGRAADPDLGRAFVTTTARILAPHGTLWMVANRHLPYERTLGEAFGEVEERPGSASFKLYRAARPRRARRMPRP